MRLILPSGNNFGWGILGDYLKRYIVGHGIPDSVALHAISGPDFSSIANQVWEKVNVGLCFVENDIQAQRFLDRAKRYDLILAGSEWNASWLRAAGVNAKCFHQGIDHTIFHAQPKRPDDNKFIVFGGGKFEIRKGQDIAIAAMKPFMDSHPNVHLEVSWDNMWRGSFDTMSFSRLIHFEAKQTVRDSLAATLEANGIDLNRVTMHPLLQNRFMPGIYGMTDIGLFPNRCEAGNNVVLCEYLACGRPAIVSACTGHLDVIDPKDDDLAVLDVKPYVFEPARGERIGNWFEARVEAVLESLEFAYKNYHEIPAQRHRVGSFTWESCAETIIEGVKGVL